MKFKTQYPSIEEYKKLLPHRDPEEDIPVDYWDEWWRIVIVHLVEASAKQVEIWLLRTPKNDVQFNCEFSVTRLSGKEKGTARYYGVEDQDEGPDIRIEIAEYSPPRKKYSPKKVYCIYQPTHQVTEMKF